MIAYSSLVLRQQRFAEEKHIYQVGMDGAQSRARF
jgi:hypothetical protein